MIDFITGVTEKGKGKGIKSPAGFPAGLFVATE
jgi:hypothetical protein